MCNLALFLTSDLSTFQISEDNLAEGFVMRTMCMKSAASKVCGHAVEENQTEIYILFISFCVKLKTFYLRFF